MKLKSFLILAALLAFLNFFAWKEVFYFSQNYFLRVSFFDVGQGDAAFIETPQGHQILIDGGPGQAVVEKLASKMPFWDRDIDLVILTHPEKDHMQGVLEILQRYKVDNFLWTGVVKNDSENQKLAELLQNPAKISGLASFLNKTERTKTEIAKAGEVVKAGSAMIQILYPLQDISGKDQKNTSNDSSVVAKVIFGNDSFLFAGDISEKAEKELVSSLRGAQATKQSLESDVLKIAHHGSKYSSSNAFLRAVSPEIAVISVGKNSYGHPTPETLQRLENFGIKVERTDQSGDIEMLSNGQTIQIK